MEKREIEIQTLLENREFARLREQLVEMNPVDIADEFEPLSDAQTLFVFRMLPKDLAAEVFSHFLQEQQIAIINAVTDKELTYIMDELFLDDMVDMIEEMPANIVDKILHNTDPNERKLINQFLKYPAGSAGSLMTIEYVTLKATMTVQQALHYIMKVGLDRETIYTCYITSSTRRLRGIVSLRKLVISPKEMLIEDLMAEDFIAVETHDDQENVAAVFKKYGFLALPVVDHEFRLTGIITVDDIMEVIDQEATEDVQIMAATTPSDTPYLETGIFRLAGNRIVWLLVLMVSATFTGAIITRFEHVLQTAVVLTAFIPMLMDTGGNSGSQPSALVIRGLALGEIEPKDWGQVVWKELRIGMIVGVVLASVNFVRIVLFDQVGFYVALVVSLTLVATVMIAKLVGCSLPILAQKIKLDPAIMAAPMITTIVDTISLLIYFSIARVLLKI